MFYLSKEQFKQYNEYLSEAAKSIEDQRDPTITHKFHACAIVDSRIYFNRDNGTITASVSKGPSLGVCPTSSDSEGLTITPSASQLSKIPNGDFIVNWTPQGALWSKDPILYICDREGKTSTSLNDDLDIIYG